MSTTPAQRGATKPDYARARLKRLRGRMQELKLDAILTLDPANLRWLTAWQGVFDEEWAHGALITPTKAYLHTDTRYSTALREKNDGDLWQVSDAPMSHFAFARTMLAKTRKLGLRLGFESSIQLNWYKALKKELASGLPSAKLVETKGVLLELRALKDAEEVALLRKAQNITDAAFANLLDWIEPGLTELEVANRLEYELRGRGAEGVSFPSIVASGPHAALPHARPTKRRLRSGDFVVLDFGARYRDYCADMTRTLAIGKASEKQQKMYAAVLDAHTKAKAQLKAGVTGSQAHEAAVAVLREAGLDSLFTHSLGHGVGIAVHEHPTLSPRNTEPLLAGHVVTVEPGVYEPGFGGVRIEDFGLVEEAGFTSFARSPRKLREVPTK